MNTWNRSKMEQEKRLLSKIEEINDYLGELNSIKPDSLEIYKDSTEKRRACERLLQILIESVIDICYIVHKGKNIGIPKDDDSVINNLYKNKAITKEIKDIISELNGFRNIIVHKYGTVDDELVFENIKENLQDFEKIRDFFLKQI